MGFKKMNEQYESLKEREYQEELERAEHLELRFDRICENLGDELEYARTIFNRSNLSYKDKLEVFAERLSEISDMALGLSWEF